MRGVVRDRQTPDAPAQAFCIEARAASIDAGQHDREFLAAVACHQVATAAECLVERLCDLAQDVIAARVAVAVVEQLELIEIEEHERQRLRIAAGAARLAFQGAVEVTAVRDAGERIDADEVLEPAVGSFQREAQSSQLFVAGFEQLRAPREAAPQIAVHAFELGLDLVPALQLGFQVACTARDPGMQNQNARERACDRGDEQSKNRELQAHKTPQSKHTGRAVRA